MKVCYSLMAAALLMAGTFCGCRKNDESPTVPGMDLVSLTSNKTSLVTVNPGDTVRQVSTTYNFVATFSNDIDFNSIRDTTIFLRRDTINFQLNFVIQGKTLIIDPATEILTGTNLILELTNKIRGINGDLYSGRTTHIETEGLGVDTPPRAGSQILYLPLNGNVLDITQHDTIKSSKIAYAVDRFGIASKAGSFLGAPSAAGGTGPVAELGGDTLITPSMTFSTWINISKLSYINSVKDLTHGVFGLAGAKGYYLEIESDNIHGPIALAWGTHHQGADTALQIQRYVGMTRTDSITYLLKDGWHHLALTYDHSTYQKTMYIDGQPRDQVTLGANGGLALGSDSTAAFTLGYYVDKDFIDSPPYDYLIATNTFLGMLDDFRVFKVALRRDEILALYEMERVK